MGILTWEQVAAVALSTGWSDADAVVAVSITEPESGRDATIIQPGQPYATRGWGLWQITPGDSEPQFGIDQAMLNPRNNAMAAHAKWAEAGGWTPWTTWQNGLNRPYIGDAAAAVAAVAHLTPAQRKKLIAEAEKGGGGTIIGGQAITTWAPQVKATHQHLHRGTLGLTAAAHALSKMRPHFTTPAVHPPGPEGIVQPIERK